MRISFLSWNLALLERSANAPLLWEQCDAEEVFRQHVLNDPPDIILLQELPGLVPFVETHKMIKANPKSHSGNLATLVAHTIEEDSISFISIPGFALLTTFESFGLTIANVHLAPGKGQSQSRMDQLAAVIAQSPCERVAIIGDTNSRSDEVARVREAGLHAPELPEPTWDSFKNRFHLGAPRFRANFTRCFTHPKIHAEDLEVISTPVERDDKKFYISDHFALKGSLTFSPN